MTDLPLLSMFVHHFYIPFPCFWPKLSRALPKQACVKLFPRAAGRLFGYAFLLNFALSDPGGGLFSNLLWASAAARAPTGGSVIYFLLAGKRVRLSNEQTGYLNRWKCQTINQVAEEISHGGKHEKRVFQTALVEVVGSSKDQPWIIN